MICMNFHKIILWAQKFSDNSIQLTRLALCFLARVCQTVTDPDQAFGGGRGCLRQSLGITQNWLRFVAKKVAIFVGRTI